MLSLKLGLFVIFQVFCVSTYKMAGRGDFAGFLKGLSLIRRALVETQGKEIKQAWDNSSLKSAAENAGAKVQENINNGQSVNLADIPVSHLSFEDSKINHKKYTIYF